MNTKKSNHLLKISDKVHAYINNPSGNCKATAKSWIHGLIHLVLHYFFSFAIYTYTLQSYNSQEALNVSHHDCYQGNGHLNLLIIQNLLRNEIKHFGSSRKCFFFYVSSESYLKLQDLRFTMQVWFSTGMLYNGGTWWDMIGFLICPEHAQKIGVQCSTITNADHSHHFFFSNESVKTEFCETIETKKFSHKFVSRGKKCQKLLWNSLKKL